MRGSTRKKPFVAIDNEKYTRFAFLPKDHHAYRFFANSGSEGKFVCQVKYLRKHNEYRNRINYDIGEVVRLRRGVKFDILAKVEYMVVACNKSKYVCIQVYEADNIDYISRHL